MGLESLPPLLCIETCVHLIHCRGTTIEGLDRKHHSALAHPTFSAVSVDPTGPVYNDHDLRTLLPIDTLESNH